MKWNEFKKSFTRQIFILTTTTFQNSIHIAGFENELLTKKKKNSITHYVSIKSIKWERNEKKRNETQE